MKYKKILLKISGEAFGEKGRPVNRQKIVLIVNELRLLLKSGVKIAVVCGGGNTIRGINAAPQNRLAADYKGMTATFKNIEALSRLLKLEKIKHKVFTSFSVKNKKYPIFNDRAARRCWNKHRLILIGGGTGYPFVSTDMAAVLRSLELGAELLIKATKVDGIYAADPKKDPQAKKFSVLTYQRFLASNLKVMDAMAVALAWANRLPIRVALWQPGNIVKITQGRALGTIINE